MVCSLTRVKNQDSNSFSFQGSVLFWKQKFCVHDKQPNYRFNEFRSGISQDQDSNSFLCNIFFFLNKLSPFFLPSEIKLKLLELASSRFACGQNNKTRKRKYSASTQHFYHKMSMKSTMITQEILKFVICRRTDSDQISYRLNQLQYFLEMQKMP